MPSFTPTLFGNGKIAAAFVEPCLLTVCNAKGLTSGEWLEYLRETSQRGGIGNVQISLIRFVGGSLNATQRHETREFIEQSQTPPTQFTAVIVENDFVRGTMIAFTFLLRRWKLQAYAPADYQKALADLERVVRYDHALAGVQWRALHELLKLPLA